MSPFAVQCDNSSSMSPLALQCDNSSSMRWQMALYKEMAGKAEDCNKPEKIVKRVQEVSAVLYHLEQVQSHKGIWQVYRLKNRMCYLHF